MKRPRATLNDVTKSNANMYGAPSNEKTINHSRELVYNFCLDYAYTINIREMLDQLLNYTDEPITRGNLKKLCEEFNFPYHTLCRLKFPILYKDFIIHKVEFK